MRVSEIVTRVRATIDELMVNDSGFLTESEDEKNLTQVIIDKISYGLQHVIEEAPLERIDSGLFEMLTTAQMASSFSIDGASKVGTLKLPDDVIRVVEARLSSWSQFPVPVSDTTQVAIMQQDQYARGSWDRPVNVMTYDRTGKAQLLMYSAKTAADTLIFVFIRKPTVPEPTQAVPDPEVGVPSRLEAAFIYQVAGLAMVAFREDVAASLFTVAEKELGNRL